MSSYAEETAANEATSSCCIFLPDADDCRVGCCHLRCCCPCFKSHDDPDDGIPPFCRGDNKSIICLLNFQNPIFATSRIAILFSNVGLPHFDRWRRRYMALAFVITLTAFLMVAYACLAIFNNKDIIPFAHWASGMSYEGPFPPRGYDFFAVFIGLRGYVLVDCVAKTEPDGLVSGLLDNDFDCTNTVYSFSDKLHSSWSGECRPACAASVFMAFSGLYGLGIAMVGTLNRMRVASDAPQQKMMGSVFDTIGSVSLAMSLLAFERGCYHTMEDSYVVFERGEVGEDKVVGEMFWWRGAAYWVFWGFVFTGGVIRAALHWLTPCPGCGVGFWKFELPVLKEGHPLYWRVVELKRLAGEAISMVRKTTTTRPNREDDEAWHNKL